MFDYSRATLIVRYSDTLSAIRELENVFGEENIVQIKNRVFAPTLAGYRDLNVLIRDPNTKFISELLILTSEMKETKYGEGHELYEQSRTITDRADAENRQLSKEEAIKVKEYDEKSVMLYNRSYNKGLRDLCSQNRVQ